MNGNNQSITLIVLCTLIFSLEFSHAQKVVKTSSVDFTLAEGGFQLIKPLEDRGVFVLSQSREKKSDYVCQFYDTDLKFRWQQDFHLRGMKKYGLADIIASDNETSVFLKKSVYFGFYPRTTLMQLRVNGSSFSSVKHRLHNSLSITDIRRFNGNYLISGTEMYKPWHPWRIIRFSAPILAFVPPLATVAAMDYIAPITLLTWFVPTAPKTRPALIKINSKGESEYIDRKRYKSGEYRNKGIQDMIVAEDKSVYLGITNTLMKGKEPIYIEKRGGDLGLQTIGKYRGGDKRKRIAGFGFTRMDGDTAHFTGTYGEKITWAGFITYGKKNTDEAAFDGSAYASSSKRNKIIVKRSELTDKNRGLNEMFSGGIYEVQTVTRKLVREINGHHIEATISENRKQSVNYVTIVDENGNKISKTQSFYGTSNDSLVFTIEDHTTGKSKTLSVPNTEFSHVETFQRSDIMHAALNVYRNEIIFTYIDKNFKLISLKIDIEKGGEIIHEENLLKNKLDIANSNLYFVGIEPISDDKFVLIRQEITNFRKRRKREYFSELEIYHIQFQ